MDFPGPVKRLKWAAFVLILYLHEVDAVERA